MLKIATAKTAKIIGLRSDGFYLVDTETEKPVDWAPDFGVFNALGNPAFARLRREERYGVIEPKDVLA